MILLFYTIGNVWPGCFSQGGRLEKYLINDYSYSEEIYIDCNVIEINNVIDLKEIKTPNKKVLTRRNNIIVKPNPNPTPNEEILIKPSSTFVPTVY